MPKRTDNTKKVGSIMATDNANELTPFGLAIRHFRLDNHVNQKVMAEALGRTNGSLSQIETGKRDIPEEYVTNIVKLFNIEDDTALREAELKSRKTFTIDCENMSMDKKKLLVALKYDLLTDEEIDAINEILKPNEEARGIKLRKVLEDIANDVAEKKVEEANNKKTADKAKKNANK